MAWHAYPTRWQRLLCGWLCMSAVAWPGMLVAVSMVTACVLLLDHACLVQEA